MKRKLFQALLFLGLLFITSCGEADRSENGLTDSIDEESTESTAETSDTEGEVPYTAEKMVFVCPDDTEGPDSTSEVRITIWQEEHYSPLTDTEYGFIYEGLLYEMAGSGNLYQHMCNLASDHGRIWKSPDEPSSPYPTWRLERNLLLTTKSCKRSIIKYL